MESASIYTAFAGGRQLALGSLRDVLPILEERFDRGTSELVLVFELESGRQVDFRLRRATPLCVTVCSADSGCY